MLFSAFIKELVDIVTTMGGWMTNDLVEILVEWECVNCVFCNNWCHFEVSIIRVCYSVSIYLYLYTTLFFHFPPFHFPPFHSGKSGHRRSELLECIIVALCNFPPFHSGKSGHRLRYSLRRFFHCSISVLWYCITALLWYCVCGIALLYYCVCVIVFVVSYYCMYVFYKEMYIRL